MTVQPQTREGLRALVGAAALGSTVGLAIGGAYLAGGLARATVVHAQIQRLAGAASGGFSETALHATASEGDAGVLLIAKRHDPLVVDDLAERDRQVAGLVDRLEARQAVRNEAPPAPPVSPVRPPEILKAAYVAPTQTAAQPFHLRGALDQSRDLECLTQAVYYEARGESRSGQQAVAQVILNRVRHPAFPKSICGVVFQGVKDGGCQFSFACDGQPHHPVEGAAWRRSEHVAAKALDGQVMAEVGDATHFHVVHQGSTWNAGLLKVAQIGAHAFYRFGGHAGAASMFSREPQASDSASLPHPVFASLSLSPGGSSTPGRLLASASAAVEHAASVVETAAKAGVADLKPSAAKPAAAPSSGEEANKGAAATPPA